MLSSRFSMVIVMASREKEWVKIDSILNRLLLLDDSDFCYYYLVRTSDGCSKSEANNRIDNFKKKPELYKNNPSVWKYKKAEIIKFAKDIERLLRTPIFQSLFSVFRGVSLVPVPTSKPKNHKDYDSRLSDMCAVIANDIDDVFLDDAFDVTAIHRPSHEGGIRDVDYLKNVITFNGLKYPDNLVILVDDVLLMGTHYVACRDKILERYPNAAIVGVFLAIHKSGYVDYGLAGL